jgi:hypothetical protein
LAAAWGRWDSNATLEDELACGTSQGFLTEIALDSAWNAAGFNEEGQ